jgi:hypothetical protein
MQRIARYCFDGERGSPVVSPPPAPDGELRESCQGISAEQARRMSHPEPLHCTKLMALTGRLPCPDSGICEPSWLARYGPASTRNLS